MLVYHGSYAKIDRIDLSQCLPNKDFGQGFYVTKFRQHAESWAKVMGRRYKTEGYITEFVYYDSPFTEHLCKVKHFYSYNEECLDFVVINRNPMSPMHDFDIVEGPIANDKIQTRINDYLIGKINKQDFLNELTYHEDTHQICFCTLKSLLTLKFTSENSYSELIHLSEKILEHLVVKMEIDEIQAMEIYYSSKFFTSLLEDTSNILKESWEISYKILETELMSQK